MPDNPFGFAQGTRGADPLEAGSKPGITSLQSKSDGLHIRFAAVPGRIYRLECCEDWGTNQWSILFDHIAGTGDLRTLIDPLGAVRPKCFYRIVITAE